MPQLAWASSGFALRRNSRIGGNLTPGRMAIANRLQLDAALHCWTNRQWHPNWRPIRIHRNRRHRLQERRAGSEHGIGGFGRREICWQRISLNNSFKEQIMVSAQSFLLRWAGNGAALVAASFLCVAAASAQST